MLHRFLLALSVVRALLKQELSGDGMESDGDYKVPMRDHNKQSSRKDKNILHDMRRYSGVLSVYGDQQWFTMNAELSARGECGNTLAIYKKSLEDGKCDYHVTIDLNKVCGMLTPDAGKNEGLHLLILFTTEKRTHIISALSAVERDNWAREISQMIGKGHSFPVVLPTQNLFGHKDAILYYNTIKKNLLLISKPSICAMEKCSLLAVWNMSEVKSFGSSRSKLVIQTKKSCNLGTSHLSFQTPMARRIVHLMQNKCEEECSCCCKPHPFSQMTSSESSTGSSSDSDDEVSVVKVEVRSRSLQRLHSINNELDSPPRNGRKTPEPSSGNKITKKAATIDRFSTKLQPVDVIDNKKEEAILNSFLFVPNKMSKFNSEGVIQRNGTIPRATRPSLPEMENTYEEIKPRVQSSTNSLYEEIPDDLRRVHVPASPACSTPPTPNGYRNSWNGQQHGKQQQLHETLHRTKTLHTSYSEDAKDTLVYEAMNRHEEPATKQQNSSYLSPHSQQQEEDSYVCMHSLTNRQSLSLKPAASDSQLTLKQNSSIPMYINNNKSDSPITYANLTDVYDTGSTRNLAYAEISSAVPIKPKSRSCSASPDPTYYVEIDHRLTEALRVTSTQRQPLCRTQTLNTTEHKKTQNKKWLTKLTSKKT